MVLHLTHRQDRSQRGCMQRRLSTDNQALRVQAAYSNSHVHGPSKHAAVLLRSMPHTSLVTTPATAVEFQSMQYLPKVLRYVKQTCPGTADLLLLSSISDMVLPGVLLLQAGGKGRGGGRSGGAGAGAGAGAGRKPAASAAAAAKNPPASRGPAKGPRSAPAAAAAGKQKKGAAAAAAAVSNRPVNPSGAAVAVGVTPSDPPGVGAAAAGKSGKRLLSGAGAALTAPPLSTAGQPAPAAAAAAAPPPAAPPAAAVASSGLGAGPKVGLPGPAAKRAALVALNSNKPAPGAAGISAVAAPNAGGWGIRAYGLKLHSCPTFPLMCALSCHAQWYVQQPLSDYALRA
jgi:hypothetical protein